MDDQDNDNITETSIVQEPIETDEPDEHHEEGEEGEDDDSFSNSSDDDDDDFVFTGGSLDQLQLMLNAAISNEEERMLALQRLLAMMKAKRSLTDEERAVLSKPVPQPLTSPDVAGVAEYIRSGHAKNIIVMSGAGISVSAGIPDFRTPGTGLYYNLQKYELDDPQEVFSIDYFRQNPKPFYELAKGLYPGQFHPTKAHYFIRLLHEHGLLLRNFTQNIDTLECVANIPKEKTVFSHGSFASAHCTNCGKEYSPEYVREKVFADELAVCECGAMVKPDIVFFGERLPDAFFRSMEEDFPKCDLLIIMGTSLQVHPFAGLISRVPETVPRLLINMEMVCAKPPPPPEDAPETDRYDYRNSTKFAFRDPNNRRDALFLGQCDDGVQALADALGWGKELQEAFDTPLPEKPTL